MEPWQLIGMPYRLGADPVRHGKADCVSLARTVLHSFGIDSPEPTRDWYRRLRRGDDAVLRRSYQPGAKRLAPLDLVQWPFVFLRMVQRDWRLTGKTDG